MLDIEALAVEIPQIDTHKSLLCTMMPKAYHHLYDDAGNFSRPSSIRRGVTMMWSESYDTPTASATERASDLAAIAVGKIKTDSGTIAASVEAVIHTQCSLDKQIVGSTCLRLEQQFFENSKEAMTIGQMGTASAHTAFSLASVYDLPEGSRIAITAADKWIAPFYRKLGNTKFADAGACMIAGKGLINPLATIQHSTTLCEAPLPNFWRANKVAMDEFLAGLGVQAIAEILEGYSQERRENMVIIGDGHGQSVANIITRETGLQSQFASEHEANKTHLSTASVFQSIHYGLIAANETGETVSLLIWTASVSGNAGACLVDCFPGHHIQDGLWTAVNNCAT